MHYHKHRMGVALLASAAIGLVASAATAQDLAAYRALVTGEPSLISYYTFDADSTVDDAPVNPHDGTAAGSGGQYITGVHNEGRALFLNGNNWVTCGPVEDFDFTSGQGTIEAWVKIDLGTFPPSGNYPTLFAVRTNAPYVVVYNFHHYAHDNALGVSLVSGYHVVGGFDVSQGWTHLAIVFNAGHVLIYTNGKLVGDEADLPLPTTPSGLSFQIGSTGAEGANLWQGQMDEIAVYSTALDAATIQSHAGAFAPLPSLSLANRLFVLPGDAGPQNVVINDLAPGAGGQPVRIDYDTNVLAVTLAGDTPVTAGSTITVNQPDTTLTLKVSAVGMGDTEGDFVATIDYADPRPDLALPATFRVAGVPSPELAAYKAAALADPTLISYYSFDGANGTDNDPNAPVHDATVLSSGTAFVPRTTTGGAALNVSSTTWMNCGQTADFAFTDGTGTIEAWVRLPAVGYPQGTWATLFNVRDDSDGATAFSWVMHWPYAYEMYFGSPVSAGYLSSIYLLDDAWHHFVMVFDAGAEIDASDDTVAVYVDGKLARIAPLSLPSVYNNAALLVGSTAAAYSANYWLGQVDELAIYSSALTPAQIAAHYGTMTMNVTPARHEFTWPTATGPLAVTVALPNGELAPTGGKEVTLTFNSSLAVTLGGNPVTSGTPITIPAGANSVSLSVAAARAGGGTLTAVADGLLAGTAYYAVRLLDGAATVYVDDHFSDNPLSDPDDYLNALRRNDIGPGSGWNLAGDIMQMRESGDAWTTQGTLDFVWDRNELVGKLTDDFPVMTPDGVGVALVVSDAHVIVDNLTAVNRPGGQFADCSQELGLFSASRAGRDAEASTYFASSTGGLVVSFYYDQNGGSDPDTLVVTGSIMAMNKTKTTYAFGDDTGIKVIGTFALPVPVNLSSSIPLIATLKVKQSGWEVAVFCGTAMAAFTPTWDLPGLTAIQGTLSGGWDANSLGNAAITDEFDGGAFVNLFYQDMGDGHAQVSMDQVKVCTGCQLPRPCGAIFADADGDDDVDQVDFGAFQACQGRLEFLSGQCVCFDRDQNQQINATDLQEFVNCFTGPAVHVVPATCNP
ncbi:MAG TPA: LamG domain-containing protein [Phycisphaerae bacterium]|nr:LamG domain-containing protein [Phycisphaerae bacterium]HSA28204.1 LamG domain-containing protein [Phycisphaerae bacterium]